MIGTEIRIILSSKISKICFSILFISTLMSFFITINDTTQIQNMNDFQELMKEELVNKRTNLETSQAEYDISLLELEKYGISVNVLPKKNALILSEEQLKDTETTLKKIDSMNDIDEINKTWIEYTLRTDIREACTSAVKKYSNIDKDPIHELFYTKIKENPALSSLLDTGFNFDQYLEVDYNTVSISPEQAQNGGWNPIIYKIQTDFYNYEHSIPTAIYDYRGIALYNTNLFMNNSIFGVCIFLVSVMFFYLITYQFCKLRINQYYISLPLSRFKIWSIYLISCILSFSLILCITYLVPLFLIGIFFDFSTINQAGILDTNLWTSYVGFTEKYFDGIFNWIPYINSSPNVTQVGELSYPGMAGTLKIVPYGLCLLIIWGITILQIIALGVLCISICLGIQNYKKQFSLIGFVCSLLAITRITYIPIISKIPIFYSSALFLLNGGHGIGQLVYWISLILWIIIIAIIGIIMYKKTDIVEG